MSGVLLEILLGAAAAILAITLHEAAHGYAAWALGDDTAKLAGRLSLNPIRHIDRVGTIILPGILLIGQLITIGRVEFMFGWAKPVPVAAWRFRDPRRGMALVAAAGPGMNFLLAWLGALGGWLLPYVSPRAMAPSATFIQDFILANVVLGLFNLLPIPPLDGGRIVVGLLPLRFAQQWARMERAGIAIVLLLIFIVPTAARQMGWQFDPIGTLLNRVVPWTMRLVFNLAGQSV
ncbi:MAG: site-2 protease family protein [Proteobacteria bacterium]|nr:site-2 protease family protein [Pseudomonadota bacterium]